MPSAAKALRTYDAKRDFEVTSEPRGSRVARKKAHALAFVVQKHDATRLHYDFRLEHDGVLWSWAIPKGPSLDPKDRRLAARTEDHPLDYASFEGTIPERQYGAGPLIVWDRGTWIPESDAAAMMKKGHLTFSLAGEKLTGRFHLVRLKEKAGQKESWLFFKSKDDAAHAGSDIVGDRPESVLSGRSIDDVREGRARPKRVKASAPTKKLTRKKAAKSATDEAAKGTGLVEALEAMSLGFSITNPDKILDATSGLTKGELMAYLAWIAPRMVPLIRDRPLMIVRCPDGRAGQCFFQKHTSPGMPSAIRKVKIAEKTDRGESLVIDDVAGLVALGQMGALEIHTWMGHAARIDRPDMMVLDIDPDEALPFSRVTETALALREILEAVGVKSFVKTTGGKGLHVVAPLEPSLDWPAHEDAALRICRVLAAAAPGRYVTTMAKSARRGKIFLDYLRNPRGSTAVAPYSPRARDGMTVSWPITWTALERGVDPKSFTIHSVVGAGLPRVDPWKGFDGVEQTIDTAKLARLAAVR